jgi:hypothetical protein
MGDGGRISVPHPAFPINLASKKGFTVEQEDLVNDNEGIKTWGSIGSYGAAGRLCCSEFPKHVSHG